MHSVQKKPFKLLEIIINKKFDQHWNDIMNVDKNNIAFVVGLNYSKAHDALDYDTLWMVLKYFVLNEQ